MSQMENKSVFLYMKIEKTDLSAIYLIKMES